MSFEIDVWWERKISFSNSFGESLGTFEEILLPVTLKIINLSKMIRGYIQMLAQIFCLYSQTSTHKICTKRWCQNTLLNLIN